MRTFVMRTVGLGFLLLAVLLQPEAIGAIGRVVWSTLASLLFAAAMTKFSRPAHTYVLFAVFTVTAIMPLLTLFAIGYPTYGSPNLVNQIASFLSKLAPSLTVHFVQATADFLLPTAACAVALKTFERLKHKRSEASHANA